MYTLKKVSSCIGNKNLTIADAERVFPYILTYLNEAYNLIKKEELVTRLQEKAVESYGQNLICHPFFQTLSLLMDDYQQRKTAYDNSGFLNLNGAKKVDEAPYQEIYNKFMNFVPECYRVPNEDRLDAEKLRCSRTNCPSQGLSNKI
ncbi:hypothetical protein GH742_08175 [Legionella sp. MW5194]|uniref:hypothetical protein n=1 Tax=Legionella sp. MW5194 TaxID=2662448 RepID=UPI00193E2929|nr:hypothetical protein [Legionella sp. MW5194]QRN03850.1 hypothetical protein GH742_08175 [Legionella sp. MW5194]